MIPDILKHPEPALLADSASVDDILEALEKCSAEDGWPEDSLRLVDFLLTCWSADFIARPDDREGIGALQHLIDYAFTLADNAAALPTETHSRWTAFRDVLEARRRTIIGRDAQLILGRSHVGFILCTLAKGERSQKTLHTALKESGIGITSPRLSQLLSLIEAHGLLTRKREGRENRLALTESGRKALPDTDPGRNASPSSTRPLRSKLAA